MNDDELTALFNTRRASTSDDDKHQCSFCADGEHDRCIVPLCNACPVCLGFTAS